MKNIINMNEEDAHEIVDEIESAMESLEEIRAIIKSTTDAFVCHLPRGFTLHCRRIEGNLYNSLSILKEHVDVEED